MALSCMPMPIYVPAMDIANQQWAGGATDTVLDLPGVPGAQIIIAAHSTIRPDGTRAPVQMYTSPVNTSPVQAP